MADKNEVFVFDPEAQGFALALRGANDGLWDWDVQRGTARFSARWKALLGYGPTELSTSINEWFDRLHPDDEVQVKQALSLFLKGGSPVFHAWFRLKTKTGEWLWMMARAQGEFDKKGHCLRLGGSLSNVTAHIKMVENLRSSEERLTQLTATLATDKALLSRYFSGDMLAAIFEDGKPGPKASCGPAAVLQIHINRISGGWARIGVAKYAAFINELVTDLMDLVYGHRGSVNKILGDTLLATFGAPLAGEDDNAQALACAAEIRRYLTTYNDVRPDFLRQELSVSAGLSCGEVFSATLGSVHRLEYTVAGPPVDKAALLQRQAAKAGLFLLVDPQLAGTALPPGLSLQPARGGSPGLELLDI